MNDFPKTLPAHILANGLAPVPPRRPFHGVHIGPEHSFVSELEDRVESASKGIEDALSALSRAIRKEPQKWLNKWEADEGFQSVLEEITSIPPEASVGFMKVSGYVPKKTSKKADMRLCGLIILYTAQVIFEGRRKGFDNFHTAVWARLERKQAPLGESERFICQGFRTLYSVLADGTNAHCFGVFASDVWGMFPEDDRRMAALCVSDMFLGAMGSAWDRDQIL